MEWWGGYGAARVLMRDGDALLLERAEGTRSLRGMALLDCDDEACRIICQVVARLHAPRARSLPELISLRRWFRELEPAAARCGGVLATSAATARELLDAPRDETVLHGDIHHGNILDFGPRGWLAIDPKGLFGERGFDYANLCCNPKQSIVTDRQRFVRRLDVVAAAADLERRRLLQWILAYAGLSAAWFLGEGKPAELELAVATQAAAELANDVD